jgi:hypothetical protein
MNCVNFTENHDDGLYHEQYAAQQFAELREGQF